MTSFTLKGLPIYPGALMLNGSVGTNGGTNSYGLSNTFPIYGSIDDYSIYGISDIDDHYIIAPGFKLTVYTNHQGGGSSSTFDNTSGTTFVKFLTKYINSGTSCKLYYGTTELNNVYTETLGTTT